MTDISHMPAAADDAVPARAPWALLGRAMLQALLVAIAALVLYPLIWMAMNGFRSNAEIFNSPFALPAHWSFAAYAAAWQNGVSQFVLSSLVVTGVSIVTTVFISAWAAYGLTRTTIPGQPLVVGFILGGMMLSPTVALVPLVRMMQDFGLYNTHWALILLYTAFRVPFTTFLIRAYMLDLPRDLDEAARMDGASEGQIFRKIILPLCRPILVSCVILHVLFAWNEYLFAMIFTNSPETRTLPVGLTSLMSKHGTDFAQVFAAMTISALPIVIVFFLTQRYFIRGLTEGIGK
ncbi:carbohydrate ABC transporter permease [Poseidonocella sp. HB161398]|uniref:carbohydrate ABC transporter permease n=1 Tax=Poseidonocella sp. HB161398 TaxID=2320855 RepID=UPI001F0F922B|nr:carbohydrate ABC transporter permease [Poseidonocella sp. HB161398]